jgi:hypothetical protein
MLIRLLFGAVRGFRLVYKSGFGFVDVDAANLTAYT